MTFSEYAHFCDLYFTDKDYAAEVALTVDTWNATVVAQRRKTVV